MSNYFWRIEDLTLPTTEWLVQGLLPERGVAFIVGAPGAGKSFLALDLAMRVARGLPVADRATQKGAAIYVAAESPDSMAKRRDAWLALNGQTPGDVWVSNRLLDLRNPADVSRFIAAALQTSELGDEGAGLGLVVIDTLAACLPGADENLSSPMSEAISSLQRIAAELGCLVLVVAHHGKEQERGIRGWSGVTAAADSVLTLKHKQSDRSVVVTKQRDGPEGQGFHFSLQELEVAISPDGTPLTSAAIVTDAAMGNTTAIKPQINDRLRQLADAIAHLNDPEAEGADCRPVSKTQLKDYLMTTDYAKPGDSVETLRKRLDRDLDRALLTGLVTLSNDGYIACPF